MSSNTEPPKILKLGKIITIEDNYEEKKSTLNLNNSDISNANIINSTTINIKNINIVKDGNIDLNGNIIHNVGNAISETDAINLGQLNNAMSMISINNTQLDKKINDEIKRATNEENIIINSLSSEISTRQLNDDEIKKNIDTMKINISDNTSKINALYAYFFGTQNVDLSKN
jgi:hypothetical protein